MRAVFVEMNIEEKSCIFGFWVLYYLMMQVPITCVKSNTFQEPIFCRKGRILDREWFRFFFSIKNQIKNKERQGRSFRVDLRPGCEGSSTRYSFSGTGQTDSVTILSLAALVDLIKSDQNSEYRLHLCSDGMRARWQSSMNTFNFASS